MQRQSSAAQLLRSGACHLGLSLSAAALLLLVHRCSLSRAERPLLLRLRCAASQSPHAWQRCDEGTFLLFLICVAGPLHLLPDLEMVERILD